MIVIETHLDYDYEIVSLPSPKSSSSAATKEHTARYSIHDDMNMNTLWP
jgi:hypothetical protein